MAVNQAKSLLFSERRREFDVGLNVISNAQFVVSAATIKSSMLRGQTAEMSSAKIYKLDSLSNNLESLSVKSQIEDFLPQGKHISSKKSFKNIKEFMAYLTLLYNRMNKLKPDASRPYVALEKRDEYQKLQNELKSATQSDILA